MVGVIEMVFMWTGMCCWSLDGSTRGAVRVFYKFVFWYVLFFLLSFTLLGLED